MTTRPNRRAVIADLAASLASRQESDLLKVAVDGVDAAGKTFFADELAEELRRQQIAVARVSIDGFHNPANIRHARDELDPARSYYEDSFDYATFRRCVLDPLRPDGDRLIQPAHFDHVGNRTVEPEKVQLPPRSILVVDGIFLGRSELGMEWDIWVFLDVSTHVARSRGVARDSGFLGSQTESRYLRRYEAGQRLYLAEADPLNRADVVVDNSQLSQPRIVRTRLRR